MDEGFAMLGNGGREHAFLWKLRKEHPGLRLAAIPGNTGTVGIAEMPRTIIPLHDVARSLDWARDHGFTTVMSGPEDPLVLRRFVHQAHSRGLDALGPDEEGAQFEGSKRWGNAFKDEFGIPAPEWHAATTVKDAYAIITRMGEPLVVKADGLAQGKGVELCWSIEEAKRAARACLEEGRFGDAGRCVVIERMIVDGQEVSAFGLLSGEIDAETGLPECIDLGMYEDYKRFYRDEEAREKGYINRNTGGLGAVTLPEGFVREYKNRIYRLVIKPTLEGMVARKIRYNGIMFWGVIIAPNGVPYLSEFNNRLGDPETEVMVRRIRSGLWPAISRAATGQQFRELNVSWFEHEAACLVLASRGYPGVPETGKVIERKRLARAMGIPGVEIFHGAMGWEGGPIARTGQLVTTGGRVMAVTADAPTLPEAIDRVYEAAGIIDFEGMTVHPGIGRHWN